MIGATVKEAGKRMNAGKTPLSNIMYVPTAMKGLADAMQYGAIKYGSPPGDKGWLQHAPEETLQSLMRHLSAHMNGEIHDPESGLPHMACVLFNVAAYMEQCAI